VDRLRKYVDSFVEVHLIDGQIIKGKLVQIDDDLMNIFIEGCMDATGRTSPAAVIMGSSISHVNIVSFPVEESLEEKVFLLLLNNGNMTTDEIAKILNAKPRSVVSAIKRLTKRGLITMSRERAPKKLGRSGSKDFNPRTQ
jgi:small nuclear ribonucleoprotein (snRNP)-like protein